MRRSFLHRLRQSHASIVVHLSHFLRCGPYLHPVTLPVFPNCPDQTASLGAAEHFVITSARVAAHVTRAIVDTASRAFEHVCMGMTIFSPQIFHGDYSHGGSHRLIPLWFRPPLLVLGDRVAFSVRVVGGRSRRFQSKCCGGRPSSPPVVDSGTPTAAVRTGQGGVHPALPVQNNRR